MDKKEALSESAFQGMDQEVDAWVTRGEWKQGWTAFPDESIDPGELARRYALNPARWQKAFSFLAAGDLSSLAPGRYELEGSDLFASVSDYVTKNEEDTLYEAHRRYADIQVVVAGEELIGVLPLAETTPAGPFDEEKDIVFLTSSRDDYRRAAPGRFFIFFPGDAHRPGVKIGENVMVRKIVVKVRLS
jgi:YhcH/YjgK/YiaL family protein